MAILKKDPDKAAAKEAKEAERQAKYDAWQAGQRDAADERQREREQATFDASQVGQARAAYAEGLPFFQFAARSQPSCGRAWV
jgi:hypothetical protein